MKQRFPLPALLIPFFIPICLFAESNSSDLVPRPIHRFTFNDETTEPGAEIVNAPKKGGVIELNGEYDGSKPTAYRVILSTPELRYQKFTVLVRLNPQAKNNDTIPLLVGGSSYRWINLSSSGSGKLHIKFNNSDDYHEITGEKLQIGKWTTFGVTCDLEAKKVRVFMDGNQIADVNVPDEFEFRAAKSSSKESEKQWMFSNYATGSSMKGQVDELVLFDSILTERQISEMCANPDCITLPKPPPENRIWTDAATGRTLEGLLQSRSPDANEVKIKRKSNGTVVTLKSERLVDSDREFIKNWKPD